MRQHPLDTATWKYPSTYLHPRPGITIQKGTVFDRFLHPSVANIQALGRAQQLSATPAGSSLATRVPAAQVRANLAMGASPRDLQKLGQFTVNAVKDLVNQPANIVGSTFNVGAGLAEAAQGRPQRLKALAHNWWHHDPYALLAQGKVKQAGQAFYKAPVTAALEASGVAHGVPRTGEIAVNVARRSAGVKPLARGTPASVPNTDIAGIRPYSGHAAVRTVQRVRRPRAIAKADRIRQEGMNALAQGGVKVARDKIAKADAVDPRVFGRHELQTRVNEHNSATEDVRRAERARATFHAAKIRGKHGSLVSLVAQRIVRPTRADIQAYVQELAHQHAHGDLSADELRANVELRDHIMKSLRTRKLNLADIAQRANRYRDFMAPYEKSLVESGMLDAAQAERAKLIPYAVRHMGARFDHAGEGSRLAREDQITQQLGVLEHDIQGERTRLQRATDRNERKAIKATIQRRESAQLRLLGERVNGRPGLGAQGRPITTAEIKAHMAAHGVEDPAFVPQQPGARGARNYFRSFAQRGSHRVGFYTRTGEATRKGTFDAHPDVLIEHAANVAGLASADRGFRQFVKEFGVRGRDGAPVNGSYKDVSDYARNVESATGRKLRPIRLAPFRGSETQFHNLLEHAGAADEGASLSAHEAMLSAVEGHSGAGEWGLVDEAAAKQLGDHLRQLGPGAGVRGLQVVNQAFRRTVLPFSSKWVTGNIVEAGLRYALLHHFNPLTMVSDYALAKRVFGASVRGHQLIKSTFDHQIDADVAAGRITPAEAQAQKIEMRARVAGGGHFELQTRTLIHRTAEQFGDGRFGRYVARPLGALLRAPGPKQLAGFVRGYTDWMTHSVNGVLERQFQQAMAIRGTRTDLLDGRLPSVFGRAADDAARGLRGTSAQVQLGRLVDEAYGRYSKFSPLTRSVISSYTPFLAWTLNAIRFVAHTLPAGHPVTTALLAAGHEASQDWLAAHGLVIGEKGALQAWMQGTIPGAGGTHIPASRYTPFGLFTDAPGSIASLVIPQYSGVVRALQGQDWKGDPIQGKGKPTPPPWALFGLALKTFADSTIPVYAQVSQTASRKGPVGVKLQRQFNPFFPIQNTAQAGGGGGATSGGDWTLPPAKSGPSGPSSTWTLPDKKQGPSGPSSTWTLP